MKNVALLFLFGLLIVSVGCRKEHVLTKEQNNENNQNTANNSDKNLDGTWVALEWQRVQVSFVIPMVYFPEETYSGDPKDPSAPKYSTEGDSYNELNDVIQISYSTTSSPSNYMGYWKITNFENDDQDLDPDYRYFIWVEVSNPIQDEIGKMKLGKREAD